jgi:hypothetical protein
MGTDQDALVGLDQNDLVLQPEGLGPLRRKANPIPAWFKNPRFRVTHGISARTLIGPALERVYATPG